MKLGTKSRYAVMAMVDLCKEGGPGPVCLADISERQDISLAYLEQIFARLRRAGLVDSARGPGGGYSLSRPAETIRVADIITAADEPIKVTRCHTGGAAGCLASRARCVTHDLWDEMGRQIHLFLSSISLADVAEGRVSGLAGLGGPAADWPKAKRGLAHGAS